MKFGGSAMVSRGLSGCRAAIRLADPLRQSRDGPVAPTTPSRLRDALESVRWHLPRGSSFRGGGLNSSCTCTSRGCGWLSPFWRRHVGREPVRTDRTGGKTRGTRRRGGGRAEGGGG